MHDNFASDLLRMIGNPQGQKNIIEDDFRLSADMLKPNTTKYRLLDGQQEYDYERDTVLPSLEDSQVVVQSTYSKAGGETGKRFLESGGAGPCVIATLYDPDTKTGLMVHFDSRSNIIAALHEMKEQLSESTETLQMRIVGGYKSEESSKRIVEQLRSFAIISKISVMEEDVLQAGANRKSVNVVLDTETGTLYDLPPDENKRFSDSQRTLIGQKMDDLLQDQRVALGEVRFIQNILTT